MRKSWLLVGMAAVIAGCGSGSGSGGPTASETSQPSASPSAPESACPAGSADQPGDPTRPRPALPDPTLLAAMDPTRPRIIVGETGFVPEGAGMPTLQSTWAFDVCTNTWAELGGTSLPAPEQRPALVTFVTDPRAGVVRGLAYWWTPVWTFDPTTDAWSAPDGGRSGYDALPRVVYDTDSGRLLAFDPWGLTGTGAKDSGVRAYIDASRAWTDLELADPAQAKPQFRPDLDYDVSYDRAAHRLVLVVTPVGSREPARTWLFDPVGGAWSQAADVPNTPDEGYTSNGWAGAFDPTTSRTWWFTDTAMLGYDARADDWTVAQRDVGWPESMMLGGVEVDPTARIVSTLIPDPVNGRLVVIGGRVRPIGDPAGGFVEEDDLLATDDVWAYQPATNTWTMLLAPSNAPASYGPG